MSAKKSQRITVSGRNLEFLHQLSSDMDESDLTKVCEYLLTDVRLLNYQIGNKISQPQPQQPQLQTPIGYSFDTSSFEPAFIPTHEENHINNQTDEVILRLASLIENF